VGALDTPIGRCQDVVEVGLADVQRRVVGDAALRSVGMGWKYSVIT
jgi:hypothetical protein